MSSLSTLPKGDSAWLLRKSIQRVMQQISVLETNIGSSTTGNSANTQIIFNDAGTLRGDGGLTYSSATDALTAGSFNPTASAIPTNGIYLPSSKNIGIAVDGVNVLNIDGIASRVTTTASATITGDLTVDTNVLKVDTLNNRVGIGTATPARPLDIVGSFQSTLGWVLTGTPAGLGAATRYIGGASTTDSWYYNAVSGGSHVWAFGESESMRLNSTGLGVGASPVEKLTVAGAAEITGGVVGQGCYLLRDGASGGGTYSAKTGNVSLSAPASGTLRFNVNGGTLAGQFDTSGNLIWSPATTAPTLSTNGQLTVNATSNTNLRFSYRGSDGVTRVANLTLA